MCALYIHTGPVNKALLSLRCQIRSQPSSQSVVMFHLDSSMLCNRLTAQRASVASLSLPHSPPRLSMFTKCTLGLCSVTPPCVTRGLKRQRDRLHVVPAVTSWNAAGNIWELQHFDLRNPSLVIKCDCFYSNSAQFLQMGTCMSAVIPSVYQL